MVAACCAAVVPARDQQRLMRLEGDLCSLKKLQCCARLNAKNRPDSIRHVEPDTKIPVFSFILGARPTCVECNVRSSTNYA
jgi:hypothetical protein